MKTGVSFTGRNLLDQSLLGAKLIYTENLFENLAVFWTLVTKRILNRENFFPQREHRSVRGYCNILGRCSKIGWKDHCAKELWILLEILALTKGMSWAESRLQWCFKWSDKVRKGGYGLQGQCVWWLLQECEILCWGAGNIEEDERIIGCNYHRSYWNSSFGILYMVPTGWIMSWPRICIL